MNCFFPHMSMQSRHHLLKKNSDHFPIDIWYLCQNQLAVYVWVYWWIPSRVLLSVFLYLHQYPIVMITVALQSVLKLGSLSSSTLFLFFKIVLATVSNLHFHLNFKISLPIKKKLRFYLDCTESVDQLGEDDILIKLILLNHELLYLSIQLSLYFFCDNFS